MAQTNVFVGSLPADIDDESFQELFTGVGTVVSCKCFPQKRTGIVKFARKDEAATVVDMMNGFMFNGSVLQLKIANQDGRTPPGFPAIPASEVSGTSEKPSAAMSVKPGKGGGVKVPPPSWAKTGRNPDKVPAAQSPPASQVWGSDEQSWNQSTWGAEQVPEVESWTGYGNGTADAYWDASSFGNPIQARPQVAAELETFPSDNLYIKNLPPTMTEDMVDSIFGNYATVVSKRLQKFAKGCSLLLRVANVEQAQGIIENLDGRAPEGLSRPLDVKFADNPTAKAKRLAVAAALASSQGYDGGFGAAKGNGKGFPGPYGDAGGFGAPVIGNHMADSLPPDVKAAVDVVLQNFGAKKPPRIAHEGDESNLYVKDLPGDADELYIYRVFAPFGAMESITIKTGPANSYAIAFVKYFTNEEAQAAVQGLTGCLLPDGRMLSVTVKTRNPKK